MSKFAMTSVPKRPDDKSDYKTRRLIGWIGLLLPALLIILVRWRDSKEVYDALDSVSAYYYTGAVAAFAGMLVAFAVILFTYDGYDNAPNKESVWALLWTRPWALLWADRFWALAGTLGAVGVAIFPTSAPESPVFTKLPWVLPWVVKTHFGSAILLFLSFAAFCFLFCRTYKDPATGKVEKADKPKKARNGFYIFFGLGIIVCMAWGAWNRFHDESIFRPEAAALILFSLAWLVKGYAHLLLFDVGRYLKDLAMKLLTPGDAARDEQLGNK